MEVNRAFSRMVFDVMVHPPPPDILRLGFGKDDPLLEAPEEAQPYWAPISSRHHLPNCPGWRSYVYGRISMGVQSTQFFVRPRTVGGPEVPGVSGVLLAYPLIHLSLSGYGGGPHARCPCIWHVGDALPCRMCAHENAPQC